MKKAFLIALMAASLSFVSASATAVGVITEDTTGSLRSYTAITASDVLATTFSLINKKASAVVVYVDYIATSGTVSSISVTPAGAITGNPTGARYYLNPAATVTTPVTASSLFQVRIPRESFGAANYYGVTFKAATVTNTPVVGAYKKIEYTY